MGLLITKDSFTGKYTIATGPYDQLNSYIEKYEEPYLADLLGADLFTLFKADVISPATAPVTAKYTSIFNAFRADHNGCIIKSEGMRTMLVAFIHFEYMRDLSVKATPVGNVTPKVENSSQANNDKLYQIYNEGVDTYYAIQWYIAENLSTYPDYNGQPKGLAHWSL